MNENDIRKDVRKEIIHQSFRCMSIMEGKSKYEIARAIANRLKEIVRNAD